MSTQCAVISGAGAGIGRAIAQLLDRQGYYVVGIEWNAESAALAQAQFTGPGQVLVGDASNRSTIHRAREVAEAAGNLTSWVNNAGIALRGNLHDPLEDEVDHLFAVNLMGVYWGCAEAVQSFIKTRTKGAIVNVSSIHGRAAFTDWAAYDTAKGGVDALTRYVAVEYGPLGIRANAVAPGAIRTELLQQVIASDADPLRAEREMSEIHPLARLGEPTEVAAVVAFLLSESASFVSGQSIAVDGAASARCFPYEPSAEIRQLSEYMK